jgi:hypothetical protein
MTLSIDKGPSAAFSVARQSSCTFLYTPVASLPAALHLTPSQCSGFAMSYGFNNRG